MKNIYVLDISETQATGFTTYKEAFFACLSGCGEVSLNPIIFHYPTDEFIMAQTGETREFRFPAIKVSDFKELALVAGRVLSLYVEDNPENIFMQNSAPSDTMITGIKACFPLGKVMDVIHDFVWATYLLGNTANFQKVVTRNIECGIFDLIDRIYKDGLLAFEAVDKIVCLSDDTFRLLHSFDKVRKDKLTIIPNGFEDVYQALSVDRKDQLKKEVGLEGCKVIVYGGRVAGNTACRSLSTRNSLPTWMPRCGPFRPALFRRKTKLAGAVGAAMGRNATDRIQFPAPAVYRSLGSKGKRDRPVAVGNKKRFGRFFDKSMSS